METKISKRLPFGISDFKVLRNEDYAYVDKTKFIELLENESNPNLFFIRPRKFGKSLFISMLRYYYDINSEDEFGAIFGDLYIGQNPTPERNSYAVMVFDFSGVDTTSEEAFKASFPQCVQESVCDFLAYYRNIFPDAEQELLQIKKKPGDVDALDAAVGVARRSKVNIYLIVDNYDHFAEGLTALELQTGKENFWRADALRNLVRCFYEKVESAAHDSTVYRTFITGVSPAALDTVCGALIIEDFSMNSCYNEMLGFTQEEAEWMMHETMRYCFPHYVKEIEWWYGGYLFSRDGKCKVYHPAMLLPYLNDEVKSVTQQYNPIPDSLLEPFAHIGRMLENEANERDLAEITKNISIVGFSFLTGACRFGKSLIPQLFYDGLLTLDSREGFTDYLTIPNYAARSILNRYLYTKRRRKHPAKVIFLDIDGVLQPYGSQKRFEHVKDEEVCEFNDMLRGKYGVEYGMYNKYDVAAVYYDWDRDALAELKRILESTGAKLVLSSDWRDTTIDRMKDFLRLYELDDYLVGATPFYNLSNINKDDERFRNIIEYRTVEILLYVEAHPQIERYVAIDDMSLNGLDKQHFVETRYKMTREDADRCIALLNS
jgi:hypothetical protein